MINNVDWKVKQLLVVLCEYKNLWTSLLPSSLIISFYIIDDVVQDVKFIYTRLTFKLWFKYINFYYSNNCCSMTPYRQFHHYHHGLIRMWCDYLRCLHSFLKIEIDLCFKFDLREVLDIRDYLKETTSALELRFGCSTIKLCKPISKI